jgi:hypothetical protein
VLPFSAVLRTLNLIEGREDFLQEIAEETEILWIPGKTLNQSFPGEFPRVLGIQRVTAGRDPWLRERHDCWYWSPPPAWETMLE